LISEPHSVEQPTLSLLTPFYNAEAYLPALIDTVEVLCALHPGRVEWVVVNDGSTDASLELLQAAMTRMTTLRVIDRPNAGVAAARNAALETARGEFVWYVDADDLIDPEAAATLLTSFDKSQHADAHASQLDLICFQAAREVVGESSQMLGLPPDLVRASAAQPFEGAEFTKALVGSKCWRHFLWTYWYRREYLHSLGLRFHPGLIHEDIAFITEAAVRAKRAAAVDANLYRYRVNATSLTQSLSSHQLMPRIESYFTVIAQLRDINEKYVKTPKLRQLLNGEVIGQSLQVFELCKQLTETSAQSQVLDACRSRRFVQSLWQEAWSSYSWKRLRQFAKMWLIQSGWVNIAPVTTTTQERN
jgi:glycosyltransferase involved in cell wall biosynthesis